MDTAALFRHAPTIFVTVCLLAYVTYNFVRGGAYARGKGWQSKEEAPPILLPHTRDIDLDFFRANSEHYLLFVQMRRHSGG